MDRRLHHPKAKLFTSSYIYDSNKRRIFRVGGEQPRFSIHNLQKFPRRSKQIIEWCDFQTKNYNRLFHRGVGVVNSSYLRAYPSLHYDATFRKHIDDKCKSTVKLLPSTYLLLAFNCYIAVICFLYLFHLFNIDTKHSVIEIT